MNQIDLDYFETLIAYKSLTDETYLASIIDYAKPEYFKNKDIKAIFKCVSIFYEKRGTSPTITELKPYLTDDTLKKSFRNVIESFNGIDKNLNKDELYENTETFLKERGVYGTLMEVVEDLGRNKADTSSILSKFEKSCNICLNYDIGLDLFPHIDKVVEDLNVTTPCISTGWKWLDNKLGGGFLQKGRSMYVFAGETNVGKSIFLGNVATAIANQNKTVLLVSLEMPELIYAKRLCTNITKIPFSALRQETGNLKAQIESYAKANPKSKILIKEFPPSTITVNHLKAFIKKLQSKGIKIDALVVDYINLLHSPTGNNSYERIKYAAEQLRALSYIFECPIITATQLNRTGYDIKEPGLNTVSESIALPATADVMLSIWQDDTDREHGVIKLGMMKNRFGANFGSCNLAIDYNTLSITEDATLNATESSSSTANTLKHLAGDN